MTNHIIKVKIAAVALSAFAVLSFSSCDTGTSPGEVNVEEGEIVEEGSVVGSERESKMQSEKDSLESHYDNEGGAVHAGDGKKDGSDRDDVDN